MIISTDIIGIITIVIFILLIIIGWDLNITVAIVIVSNRHRIGITINIRSNDIIINRSISQSILFIVFVSQFLHGYIFAFGSSEILGVTYHYEKRMYLFFSITDLYPSICFSSVMGNSVYNLFAIALLFEV